jgi:hypothetical protein
LRRPNYREILRILDIVYHSLQTAARSGDAAELVRAPEQLPPVAPEPPPRVTDEWETHERRRARRERGALWARWLTLLAIVAFTAISYVQVHAARDQLAETQRENALAERPYIFITALSIGADSKGRQAQAVVALANYGHSPAFHTRTAEALVVGDASVAVTREAVAFFTSPLTPDAIAFDYPPTTPGDNRISFPLVSTAAPAQVKRALSIDGGLKALVRSEYSDAHGHPYSTEACFYRRADGSIGACDQYNHLE